MKNVLIILSILVFLSCKKNDPEPKSNFEMLTNNSQKSWKLSDGSIKLGNDSQLSILGSRPTCETDNLLVLKSDKTYDVTEGETKCNLNDPNVIISSANWSISDDGKILSVDRFIFLTFEIVNAKFDVIDISDTEFSGETEVEFQGQKYTGVVKFTSE